MAYSTDLSEDLQQATRWVFGDSSITQSVEQACRRYQREVEQIEVERGLAALLIAIVGAKGQGKTWAARQLILDGNVRRQLPSGDLTAEATTRQVWIGPVPPERLDPGIESYIPCQSERMVAIGQPYVILDTPGLTDADRSAAEIALEALALAPVKVLVIARDQLRAAANMTLAHQVDGALCIPVITSVEPDELPGALEHAPLLDDLRQLKSHLQTMAPNSRLATELLIPDFDITDDEQAASQVFVDGLLERLEGLQLSQSNLQTAKQLRLKAATERLRSEVAKVIADKLPDLQRAVNGLRKETQQLPSRVLQSVLGSETVLETGIRLRLRVRLVSDTLPLWFPYRVVLSILNLTQGAWDRVMLSLSGSVPSLFGAMASYTKNVRQSRELDIKLSDGVRQHAQQQVEERLLPLCDDFHRTVRKLGVQSRLSQASGQRFDAKSIRLMGIEELQTRSQDIFQSHLERHATPGWLAQPLGIIGIAIFWGLLAAPIVTIYRDYLNPAQQVFLGSDVKLEQFPQLSAGLFFTSLLLSLLPLVLYAMLVLTLLPVRRRVQHAARAVRDEHNALIQELHRDGVIRLEFEDELLQQAEYLMNFGRWERNG